ncbi:MAG: IscS subfamily cysteine desulfurase [Rickettsiaceae bacterium]|nr:IscS subfamily cysteine desulfurase [Rickettsiaceae bacterium]
MSINKIEEQKNSLIKSGTRFPVYLDYQATTPTDPRVVDAMIPYFYKKFGNPHSRSHAYGWEAEAAIELARDNVAKLINAAGKEIIFTSGATESNNLAIKGVARFYKQTKDHIIVSKIEHKCILDAARHMELEGFKVTYLDVLPNGLIDIEALKSEITERTALVSIIAVNNEIGVIQPLEEIGRICRNAGAFFHSDIAQGYGKIKIDVEKANIDLASISGHKIYGPKGVGALYIRKRPRVKLEPIFNGGGQERGMRSGTVPTPLVVGLGEAAKIAYEEMETEYARIKHLSNYFLDRLHSSISDIFVNGDLESRYPGNLNISFSCVEGESMILAIKDLAVSSGSACTSSSLEPSYVLRAIGVSDDLAHTSIRFGFGRFTTIEEVEFAASLIIDRVQKLRDMSPLWEMVQEGIDLKQIKWTEH